MFAYDTGILKREDRLQAAFDRVTALAEEFKDIAAPHTHELVRLKETEAMLLAAQFILGASLYRTESRLAISARITTCATTPTGCAGWM